MLNRAVQPAACTNGRGGVSSVNEALRPLFHLLRAVADRQPAALGASVLGLSEVHARWRHFVASWRALAPGAPLHFCSSDIAQCYDTIDQVTHHEANPNPNPNGANPNSDHSPLTLTLTLTLTLILTRAGCSRRCVPRCARTARRSSGGTACCSRASSGSPCAARASASRVSAWWRPSRASRAAAWRRCSSTGSSTRPCSRRTRWRC